jgi:GTP cyclohydrolase II
MNHLRSPLTQTDPATDPAKFGTDRHRSRSGEVNTPPSRYVRHAILDARAGLPVVIFFEDARCPPVAVIPAETATQAGLAAFATATLGAPQLALAPSRAETIGAAIQPHSSSTRQAHSEPSAPDATVSPAVAFHLAPHAISPATLQAFADPTRPQPGAHPAPTPAHALAGAALQLAKHGRLLPAMLLAEADPSHGLTSVSAEDVHAYREDSIASLIRVAEASLPLAEAQNARLVAFRPADGGVEHVALLIGEPEKAEAPLVRIHSECFTGDLLGSLRCDCGPQLHQAIQRMEAEGSGVLLYMAQEGRGIGLVNKLRAYALQDRGLDTLDANRALGWDADERNFAAAALMLRDLGITRVRLLTNNPDKVAALQAAGIDVAGRLRHAIAANGVNDSYLETKARRFGHLLG